MSLDWFTFVAQIINFLVLVALLKVLFYDRVIDAMNAREASIKSRLDAAAQEHAAAEQEAREFRQKNERFDDEHASMLAQANEEVASYRMQMLDDARADAEAAQGEWLKAMQRERDTLLQTFRERLARSAFELASRGLEELADAKLEAQIVERFVARLKALDGVEREAIAAAARGTNREVEVRTAFALPDGAQDALVRAVRECLDDGITVRFARDPALICGIELRAHAHRVAWNLDSYLEGLEARVFEVLDERAQ